MPIRTSHCSWPVCTRAESGAGSGSVCQFTSLRAVDVALAAMEDEDRLAAPEHLDDLALGDGREIDLERGAGGDGRGVRFHLADQRHKGRRRADGCRRFRSQRGGNRGAKAPPRRLLSRSQSSSVLPGIPSALRTDHPLPTSRLRETEGAGPAADGRVSFRPGGDQKRRNPARFYWHPCRGAQVCPAQRRTARLPQRPCTTPRAAPMRIALYQPDIPQNTGTILRLCACLGIEAHIIGPAGFPTSDRAFRRAGMDYLDAVAIVRHRSWRDFESWRSGTEGHRLVLFTTAGAFSYLDYRYRARRHPAVRPRIGRRAAARSTPLPTLAWSIPMRPGLRSLNVAIAAAMAAGEALRQTGGTTSAAADRESDGDKVSRQRPTPPPRRAGHPRRQTSSASKCPPSGHAASETTRMRTCICVRSRSTQT